MECKFNCGTVVYTAGVSERVEEHVFTAEDVFGLVRKHATGDWGEVCDEDKLANEDALQHECRLLSAYTLNGVKLWVITEADRHSTTVLLPEEY